MKVLVSRTTTALDDARREAGLLGLKVPGCLSLLDFHEEVVDDGTAVVYIVTPCVLLNLHP